MLKKIMLCCFLLILLTGCSDKEESQINNTEITGGGYAQLMQSVDVLELFEPGTEATVFDIETGETYTVRRAVGGYETLADVETVSSEDTAALISTAGGDWNVKRRAVIVTIGDVHIAASIAPLPHSGSEDVPYGEYVDLRNGATGPGINLDSIRDNDLIGVVDIYFYNSLIPVVARIDELHQSMVLKAYQYEK